MLWPHRTTVGYSENTASQQHTSVRGYMNAVFINVGTFCNSLVLTGSSP